MKSVKISSRFERLTFAATIAFLTMAGLSLHSTEEVNRRVIEASPPSASRPLSIVTWNMNWLHREDQRGVTPRDAEDYEALARYARDLDADVIILQEVDGEEAIHRLFDPSRYRYHVSSRGDVQRVAIVYRSGLHVTRHPDVVELARVHSERLRYGVDLSVFDERGEELRLLGVHLKSGCFSSPIDGPYAPDESERACRTLAAQLPVVARWMRRRVAERTPFVIAGDFNRRLHPDDEVWRRWHKGVPEAHLYSPTMWHRSRCWGGLYPELIDHLIWDRRAHLRFAHRPITQTIYDERDARRHGYRLSDHCPVGIH